MEALTQSSRATQISLHTTTRMSSVFECDSVLASDDESPCNLITKITSYKEILNIPNSVTVLLELLLYGSSQADEEEAHKLSTSESQLCRTHPSS